MNNFKKGKKFGGGGGKKFGGGERSFGGDRSGSGRFGGGRDRGFGIGGDRDGSRRDMHKAVCSDCGNNCEVPFRPTGDKPIFCSGCFKSKRDGSQRDSRDGRDRGFGDRKPRPNFGERPSYQGGGKDTTNYKSQFEMLNAKLDTILKAIAPTFPKEPKDIIILKSEKFEKTKTEKTPKKEVDRNSLKKTIVKTITKKPIKEKKVIVKKTIAKKKK